MTTGRNDSCSCGSGLKYKKCCLLKSESQQKQGRKQKDAPSFIRKLFHKPDQNSDQKILMKTVTGEIYQPVRLYYKMLDKNAVQNCFKKLRCVDFDRKLDRWVWLYLAESKNIQFPKPYNKIDKASHPVVIGSFFTKVDDEMHLDVRSIERAVEAVLFFDKHVDRSFAKVTHAAVLNRLPIDDIDSPRLNFDEFFDNENMEIIDPEQTIEELNSVVSDTDDVNERREKALMFMMGSLSNKYPEAEKFPIHYYEDGIDSFRLSLRFNQAVAYERWKGNENVTHDDVFKKILGNMPKF